MYVRFTDRARKVMQLANEEAERFNHESIGTEHILLGLVKEGSGVAANVLKNLDVDLRRIRLDVENLIQSGPDWALKGDRLPLTPQTKKFVDYAMEEARALNHNYVGSEHILLGLLREEEGVAAQILMNLGLTLEAVRAEVRALLGHTETEKSGVSSPESSARATEQPAENVEEPPAVCPKCGGSRVVRILWNCVDLSSKDQEDVAAERAILARKGGRNLPSWTCLTCEPRWSEVHRLALQYYLWQLAKEEAIALDHYETAICLRDLQHEMRLRLTALVKELLGGQ